MSSTNASAVPAPHAASPDLERCADSITRIGVGALAVAAIAYLIASVSVSSGPDTYILTLAAYAASGLGMFTVVATVPVAATLDIAFAIAFSALGVTTLDVASMWFITQLWERWPR